MVVFLAFAGCQKDETALADETTPTALFAKGDVPPAAHEPRCVCEYQVVSTIAAPAPPLDYQFGYNVHAEENCVSTLNCKRFSLVEGCDFANQDPCSQYIAAGTPKPTQWFPFHCQQVYYSTFHPTVRDVYYLPASCLAIPVEPEGEIVVRFRCKGKDTGGACQTDWVTTPNISLHFAGGFLSMQFPPSISLNGCGCSPTVNYPG